LALHRLIGEGIDLAWGDLGVGSPVIVVPAWMSNLEVIAEGAILDRRWWSTSQKIPCITYDRCGTGLSGGTVRDFGVDAAVGELDAVLEHLAEPAALVAMSERGRSHWRARPADPIACRTSCCSGRTRTAEDFR